MMIQIQTVFMGANAPSGDGNDASTGGINRRSALGKIAAGGLGIVSIGAISDTASAASKNVYGPTREKTVTRNGSPFAKVRMNVAGPSSVNRSTINQQGVIFQTTFTDNPGFNVTPGTKNAKIRIYPTQTPGPDDAVFASPQMYAQGGGDASNILQNAIDIVWNNVPNFGLPSPSGLLDKGKPNLVDGRSKLVASNGGGEVSGVDWSLILGDKGKHKLKVVCEQDVGYMMGNASGHTNWHKLEHVKQQKTVSFTRK